MTFQTNANTSARAQALPYEARRHGGLFNVVFCDTHAESLKPARLFDQSEDNARRWNRDHEPHLSGAPP